MRSTRKASGDEISSTAELAKRLNLSRWTVSRVLNGHEGVHPETVARIQNAMAQYGFSPNALAQGLKTGRTNIIGICLPELEGLYLGQKLEFLRNALAANGYHVMVGITNGDPQEELSTLNRFRELRAAGVILVASQIDPASVSIRQFLKTRTPLIQIDPMTEPSSDSISIDRGVGMKEAVRHLLDLGHRHIASLGLSPEARYSKQRMQGIVDAYKEHGLNPEEYFHSISLPPGADSFYQQGHDIAAQVWNNPCGASRNAESPTAILTINDRCAIGLIHGFRELGVRVPEDLSLIGYDNMEVGAFISPKLSTIDARPDELIQQATEHLLKRIGGEEPAEETAISIPARLLCRESTGPGPLSRTGR